MADPNDEIASCAIDVMNPISQENRATAIQRVNNMRTVATITSRNVYVSTRFGWRNMLISFVYHWCKFFINCPEIIKTFGQFNSWLRVS